MITKISPPRTNSVDELFQNPAVQDFLQPGMATPRPVRLPSGERALAFCFREKNEFIADLKKPLFEIRFGWFVVDTVWVPKLMLLVLNPQQPEAYSLAEMSINWHDTECGLDVIDLLADGAPLLVRFYGDDWRCKKMVAIPPIPQMDEFFEAARQRLKELPAWTAEEFGQASGWLEQKHGIKSLWSEVLPGQMKRFGKLGKLDDSNPAGESEVESETTFEERRTRHKQFISDQYPTLAAFAWEGFQERGRGTILVRQGDTGAGCQIRYLSLDEIEPGTPSSPEPKIRKYTPETQIVVTIDEEGMESTYLIGDRNLTPPVAYEQNGKQIDQGGDQPADELHEFGTIVIQVERAQVEAGDLRPVLQALEAAHIRRPNESHPQRLLTLRGGIGVPISGYDSDPRELYEIQEVRRFWQKLHKVWPYGLYFLDRRLGSIQTLVLSHIDVTVHRDGSGNQVGLKLSKEQVAAFMQVCLRPYLELSQRAGVPADEASKCVNAIAMLFGIRGGPEPGD
jgi:hypothetical protein